MEPTKIPGHDGHDEARRRLLEEGARTYLDAVTALIEYQNEVQKKCREVMRQHIDDYGDALKLRLKPDDIQRAAWPKFEEWEGDWWTLGARMVQ